MGAEPAELAELEAAARRLREEGAAAGRAEALDRLAAKLRSAMKAVRPAPGRAGCGSA